MKASEKVTKARAGLVLDSPFFGSLALRLRVVADPTCETLWTDGERLGYSPAYVDGLSLAQVKGVLAHEVMHCACAHQGRRGARDAKRWNVATDHAINQVLEDARFTLPEGRLLDPAFSGLAAEAIYPKLPNPPPEGGDGDGDGDKPSDPGGCGEVRDAPNPNGTGPASPSELAQGVENWKVATAQAAQQARGMGRLPAGLERLVESILAPRVDWRAVLRRFVSQAAKSDYSWSRPNRRHVARGIYLPSLRSEELGPLVIAVDTSGSIGGEEVAQFAAEASAILEEFRTTATVIYCDAAVANVEEVTSDDLPLVLHPMGGGGTDFRPAFDYVAEHDLTPSCLVYLTDLEGCFPKSAPAYPVLWAVLGKTSYRAPWGEEVAI